MRSKPKRYAHEEVKKNKRFSKSVALSIVALIEIIAFMGVSTFSWVESVSSIMIHTTGQTVSGGTKGVINDPLYQRASVGSTGNAIDLTQYVRPSGDFHMTAASSADGKTMYFPETRKTSGSQSTNYRMGTISDRNVNYICFTFKVTSNNYFAFDEEPVIKFNGIAVSNSLVRIAFGVNGNFNVYGKTAVESESVPTSGSNASTSVRAFGGYVKGKAPLFQTTNGSTFVTVSIWIQDPTFASYSTYNNKQFTIDHFKLVPVSPFTANAVYVNDGVKILGGAGGTVAINDGDFGATATAYVASGQQITIKATPNYSNGYDFSGWATTSNATSWNIAAKSACTTANYVSSYTYTVGSVSKIYAHFSDEHILYLSPGYKHYQIENSGSNGRYAAYIWGNVNGQLKKEWYVMSWDQSQSKYKLTYKGSANSVIFCYMNPNHSYTNTQLNEIINNSTAGWTYKYLQTFDLTFPQEFGEYTYVTTSRYMTSPEGTTLSDDNNALFVSDKLFGYWDYSGLYATATAEVDGSGGTVTAKLANSTSSYSTVTRYKTTSTTVKMDPLAYTDSNNSSIKYEKKVILTATPGQAYNFEGWYLNGTKVATTATATVELPDNSSGTVTYKAKFTEKPEEWYIKGSFNSWGTDNALTQYSGNEYRAQIQLNDGNYEFKVYDGKRDKWYSNQGNYYADESSASYPNNTTIPENGNSNQNIKLWATKGTYTFKFNISTKQLTITPSYDTVRIWFNTSSFSSANDGNAKFRVYISGFNSDSNMTKSGNNWYIDVQSVYRQSIYFKRYNPNDYNNVWHEWSAGDRPAGKDTYYATNWAVGKW